ncbi:hypothetical protein Tco_0817629 [Tanacetum coccineum]
MIVMIVVVKWMSHDRRLRSHWRRRSGNGRGCSITSSSLEILTNNCLGGIMVSLIFLEGLDEEALVEVMVAVSSSLRLLEPKCTIESRAKRSSINLVRTQHPSETKVFHNEDGNPARANIKQAFGYLKDGDGNGN